MNFFFCSLNQNFRKRSHLRAQIRGYAKLKREESIGLCRRVKSALSDTILPGITESASPLIFGAAIGNAERTVRQYLFERHISTAINRAILHALGSKSPLVFALPPPWQQVLSQHNLNVNTKRSTRAWRWRMALYFGRNILIMGQTLLRVLIAQGMALPQERYAYLEGLSIDNLPTDGSAGSSYDICSWYAQWDDRSYDLNSVRHNVMEAARVTRGLRIEPLVPPFLLLRGTANFMRLFAWCFVATLVASFDLLRGRWWHSLLLSEATFEKAVSLSSAKVLAVDYLFHYSGNIYRPLWTYEAEKKGARIICYFYSTFEQPKLTSGYESQKFEWGAASWPIYLVWDKYQEAQLRRDLGDEPEIRIVGPIWFTAGAANLELKSNSVAVFDVEAHRLATHFPFSTAGDYIAAHPDLSERFLRDVQLALKEQGLLMAFKRKRNIDHRGTKKYKKLIQNIADSGNVFMVPTNVAILQLTEQCVGMISMPFTSTALYQRERNIPSVYYDPTGWIQRDDRAAHGIPVLIGINELRHWISSILPEGPK